MDDEFLRRELKIYCSSEQLDQAVFGRPAFIVSKDIIDRIANACINSHTTKVTTISTVAGMPGGFAMAATIPADMAQYYWHVFVLSQKLAYLYGFPDLRDEKGNLTDTASDLLTLFVGVMMGASAANQAIKGVAKELAKQVVKRLPQKALTKTIYYPIIKQVAKWIGVKLTKETFAKGVGKAIPILGGIISGGLTLATFRPSAKRLQRKLQEEMSLLNESSSADYVGEHEDEYVDFDDVVVENSQEGSVSKEKLSLMLLINIAKVDHDFTEKKKEFINELIENSELSEDEQLELAASYNTNDIFQIDFNVFRGDDVCVVGLIEKMVLLSKLDGKISLAEKIYLKKVARELNFSPEDLEDLLRAE